MVHILKMLQKHEKNVFSHRQGIYLSEVEPISFCIGRIQYNTMNTKKLKRQNNMLPYGLRNT